MKYFSDVYKKETKMCRRLFQEKQGCRWGKCEFCGVVPLLYKLENGVVIKNEDDIKTLKDEILK
jgi:hypothetical protein